MERVLTNPLILQAVSFIFNTLNLMIFINHGAKIFISPLKTHNTIN